MGHMESNLAAAQSNNLTLAQSDTTGQPAARTIASAAMAAMSTPAPAQSGTTGQAAATTSASAAPATAKSSGFTVVSSQQRDPSQPMAPYPDGLINPK